MASNGHVATTDKHYSDEEWGKTQALAEQLRGVERLTATIVLEAAERAGWRAPSVRPLLTPWPGLGVPACSVLVDWIEGLGWVWASRGKSGAGGGDGRSVVRIPRARHIRYAAYSDDPSDYLGPLIGDDDVDDD